MEIPEALRCYALGYILFGFIIYNVLAGMLLRDIVLDPNILCSFLKCNQDTAVNWFLELSGISSCSGRAGPDQRGDGLGSGRQVSGSAHSRFT